MIKKINEKTTNIPTESEFESKKKTFKIQPKQTMFIAIMTLFLICEELII